MACTVSESIGGTQSEYSGLELPLGPGELGNPRRSSQQNLEAIDSRVDVSDTIEQLLNEDADLYSSFRNTIKRVLADLPESKITEIKVRRTEDPEYQELMYNEIEITMDFDSMEEWFELREIMKNVIQDSIEGDSEIFFMIEPPDW